MLVSVLSTILLATTCGEPIFEQTTASEGTVGMFKYDASIEYAVVYYYTNIPTIRKVLCWNGEAPKEGEQILTYKALSWDAGTTRFEIRESWPALWCTLDIADSAFMSMWVCLCRKEDEKCICCDETLPPETP